MKILYWMLINVNYLSDNFVRDLSTGSITILMRISFVFSRFRVRMAQRQNSVVKNIQTFHFFLYFNSALTLFFATVFFRLKQIKVTNQIDGTTDVSRFCQIMYAVSYVHCFNLVFSIRSTVFCSYGSFRIFIRSSTSPIHAHVIHKTKK